MDFFRGKKKNQSDNKNLSNLPPDELLAIMEAGKNFDGEIVEAFARYYSDPALSINIEIKDDQGHNYPPHMAYGELFGKWLGIQSKWDRMSLLYRFWDDSQVKKLEDWQIIERFVKDRYPLRALEIFKEKLLQKEHLNAKELVSISKMHRALLENEKARKYMEAAYENFPDDDAVKVEYASVLHLSEDHSEKERSHQILNDVLDKKIKREDTESVFECFLFSEDYLDSSVFAMAFLVTSEADLNQWDTISEEYYYCPLFRYEHAIKLANSNESMRAMAKLTSLSQEFPWFRTALETTVKNIESLRVQLNRPDFMEKEMQEFQHHLNT
ncbi:hypothetical protein [Chryseobacterium sp. Alg-005]|uniref:hypothetical protein n=1 Tax=Chryseobacterium sp. Alg-005 TaxID=3159516 RepID=UPI0036F3D527